MALVLNEDQKLVQESARGFCKDNAPLTQLRKLRDSKESSAYSEELWQQMIELGWAGMAIPEEYGGFDFGYTGLGLVLQETGRTLVSSPLIGSVLLSANLINLAGTQVQKQSLLPRIVAGELKMALALDETAHHRPNLIRTNAVKNESGFCLNGSKTFVIDGGFSDQYIVVARTSGEDDSEQGISLFLVNAKHAGVSVTRTVMIDSRNAAKLSFDNVCVDAEALIGELDKGYDVLDAVLDIARIGVAAEMLGSIEALFESIIDYLQQRKQFGVLIGSFQGLQHRAATMYSEIELCKSLVLAALSALDDGEQTPRQIALIASATKSKLSEVFELVSNEGIQMYGGVGMTDEFDLGLFIKRARVAQQFLGDALFHRDRYASLSGF